eukprot:CAMPEP_0195518732 /NCGR_PEP_ID=MMETSP0794_2-20130614/13581_1 /TAXON_ID=515487 /ORGANISM="Stephanopyxis turris, Strain CCMP 815" /LENGTH=433 /DNA_ID=CAMNT_0040647753 /DNA_START=87 /DNA_END=1388 /DNA_ORIENTATION=+
MVRSVSVGVIFLGLLLVRNEAKVVTSEEGTDTINAVNVQRRLGGFTHTHNLMNDLDPKTVTSLSPHGDGTVDDDQAEFFPVTAYKQQQVPSQTASLYLCSHAWLFEQLGRNLFPEYQDVKLLMQANPSDFTKDDIIITHPGYDCDQSELPGFPKESGLRLGREGGFEFPGKILYVNGQYFMDPRGHRDYHLGYLEDSNRSVQVFWAAILALFGPTAGMSGKIFDLERKPKQNSKRHFLLYVTSNCKDFREDAFDHLSHINDVHYGGACRGSRYGANPNVVLNPRIKEAPLISNYHKQGHSKNYEFFSDYRFALVMENAVRDGYITGNIMNAFLSGSIPIWYGTRDVFKVFNANAFVYYDVENPQAAYEQIHHLETNQLAYEEMLSQPILANGAKTMEDFFSLVDVVGHGHLKKKIRNMMGFTTNDDRLSQGRQ